MTTERVVKSSGVVVDEQPHKTVLTLPAPDEVIRERKGGSTSRFWAHVEKTDSCWNWTASRFDTGYGAFWYRGRVHKAHRIAWLLTHGALPVGLLLHKCDNPPCVNPDHLYEGTHKQNTADMDERGRRTWRHPKAKLTEEQVHEARRRRLTGETYQSIGHAFGVTWVAIWKLVNGKTWRDLPERTMPVEPVA